MSSPQPVRPSAAEEAGGEAVPTRCPPSRRSLLDNKDQKAVHDSCGKYVKQERNLPSPPRFCGAREGRLNPCWSETAGNGSALSYCLPHFFILGETQPRPRADTAHLSPDLAHLSADPQPISAQI